MKDGSKRGGSGRDADGRSTDFVRTWDVAKMIVCEGAPGLAVKITKSNDRFPAYNWELVHIAEDGRAFSRMRVDIAGRRSGTITLAPMGAQVAELFELARVWIHQEAQAAEDAWIEWSRGRDRAEKPSRGLKSWSKRDAEKRVQKAEVGQ